MILNKLCRANSFANISVLNVIKTANLVALKNVPPNNLQTSSRSITTGSPNSASMNEVYTSLSQSGVVMKVQQLVENVHDFTHLPWWATIIVTTVSLRLVITLPLAAYQHYIFAKLANLKPEMASLLKELQRETDVAVRHFKWDEKTARRAFSRSAKNQWNKLVERENCHQGKASILLWAQLPLWVIMSVSLRNMATMLPIHSQDAFMLYVGLTTGGFGWIPNLTDVDHSLILPVTMAFANLAIIQLLTLTKVGPTSFVSQSITNVFRVFCIVMVPIAAYAPSGVVLYWTTSSMYGLLQNLLLLSPKVRRLFRIPKTATENPNPYHTIIQQIRLK